MDDERLIDFLEGMLALPTLSCGLVLNLETIEAMNEAAVAGTESNRRRAKKDVAQCQ